MAREVLSLHSVADLLSRLMPKERSAGNAIALLRGNRPDAVDMRLDGRCAALGMYLDAIDQALVCLTPPARSALWSMIREDSARLATIDTGADRVIDGIAMHLLNSAPGAQGEMRRLAIAIGRVLEENAPLQPRARTRLPLGRGFEPLFKERLERRYEFLPGNPGLLVLVSGNLLALLEDPEFGATVITERLGRELTASERRWLEVERRAGTLRFVRKDKTDEGHIRWFVRPDARHDFVLDRLGAYGHWFAEGDSLDATQLVRLVNAVERVIAPTRSDGSGCWNVVRVGRMPPATGPTQPPKAGNVYLLPPGLGHEADILSLRRKVRAALRAHHEWAPTVGRAGGAEPARGVEPRAAWTFALRAADRRVDLVRLGDDEPPQLIASVDPGDNNGGDDEALIRFLDAVDRVSDISVPLDQAPETGASGVLPWIRAWLRYRCTMRRTPAGPFAGLRVRLCYIPSSIPHQLGGFPQIGLEFLRDRLERAGARVDVLTIHPDDYASRVFELLGADVIGLGVYIHNKPEVAELVRRLRALGYSGKIVLGGPEVRDVDAVQNAIPGWDAIIRGEAEDTLPAVLDILAKLDAGRWEEALAQARTLRGVILRAAGAVMVCETAARNSASAVECPLPFDWMAGKRHRRLQMNFTRGCPYQCTFCPNHQGRRFRSGHVDALWRYAVLAVADELELPMNVKRAVAERIQEYLAVDTPPRLRVALHLLARAFPEGEVARSVCAPLIALLPADVAAGRRTDELVGVPVSILDELAALPEGQLCPWQVKNAWLAAKLSLLAARQADRGSDGAAAPDRPPFVLETSEDNTLVNRAEVTEFLRRRSAYGLTGDFVFNPGQNTIWDLTDKQGGADVDYIDRLVRDNRFAVALGADGTSNPVLRQNRKPFYRVHELLAVNSALAARRVEVANNYILLTAETDFLEAVESFLLFLMLPIAWRDYGTAINLRVIKEDTTLSTDEGIVWAPRDEGFDVPLRFVEVQRLLDRWNLTSRVASDELDPLLWRMIENDPQVQACLPDVIERWERDYDRDPTLVDIAGRIRARWSDGGRLVDVLRLVGRELRREYPDGR